MERTLQKGFFKKFTTQLNILHIMDIFKKINEVQSKEQQYFVLFIEFSKAFDLTNHSTLREARYENLFDISKLN
jgi:hypothetical protein